MPFEYLNRSLILYIFLFKYSAKVFNRKWEQKDYFDVQLFNLHLQFNDL